MQLLVPKRPIMFEISIPKLKNGQIQKITVLVKDDIFHMFYLYTFVKLNCDSVRIFGYLLRMPKLVRVGM